MNKNTNSSTDADIMTHLQGATIQHGSLNKRIYLMNLNGAPAADVIPALESLANEHHYTKIFAKVPASVSEAFCRAGYRREAEVPGFFKGKEDAVFLGRYLNDPARAAANEDDIRKVVRAAEAKRGTGGETLPALEGLDIRPCREDDLDAMGRLYRGVFDSYPFPIHDPEFLKETMRSHVAYYCIEHRGQIIALSSAEMDEENQNVEMTDFATDTDWRGRRLATHLLAHMEKEMAGRGILTAYTISRAASYAINMTFSKMGYGYGGALINNTHIAGKIESMLVWYKALPSK